MVSRARLVAHALFCAPLLAIAAPQAAFAQSAPADFSVLAERLMPAVVNIATTQRVEGVEDSMRFPHGSPLERYNDLLGEEGLREVNSLGSGFVVSADGVVVTNNHVIEGADEIEVIFQDGERLAAEIVGRDPATDLAVLRVAAGRKLPFVRWGDSDGAKIGNWVIAIGNPFGLGGSVSAGIISARNRDIAAGRYDDFIQTDAAINRGNSGGPLFNMSGEVIGVNTAIVSPTGVSVGVGFATPSDLARAVVDQILRYGETRRGWLGVRMGVLTPELAARAGLPRPRGALIAAVTDDGPAADGGLRPGDIVLVYNGQQVAEGRNLTRLVADTPEGATVTIEFLRGDKRLTTTVTVERLEETDADGVAPRGGRPAPSTPPSDYDDFGPPTGETGTVLGMELTELDEERRREFGAATPGAGLLVIEVDPDGEAHGKLRSGDLVLELAFEPVETIAEARAIAARAASAGAPLLVKIQRDGRVSFRALRAKD